MRDNKPLVVSLVVPNMIPVTSKITEHKLERAIDENAKLPKYLQTV